MQRTYLHTEDNSAVLCEATQCVSVCTLYVYGVRMVCIPYAPDVQYPFQALLHRSLVEEGNTRSSARHIHNDLSQGAHLFLRPIIVGNVIVLGHHVPVLPALSAQYLLPAPPMQALGFGFWISEGLVS